MRQLLHPSRAVALGFLFTIVAGTLLLRLPLSHAKGEAPPWLTAFFTATSAVCGTGLVVVDTGTYWSSFGQWVILALFQIGGFGMMTAATLLGLMVNRSLPLRAKLITQVETDIASVTRLVVVVTVVTELGTALWLTVRLHSGYNLRWGEAAWNGLFHAVSAFNNADFSIYPDSLMRYSADALMLVPVMVAIVAGGIGFPVLYDLREKIRAPVICHSTPSSRYWPRACCCSPVLWGCCCSNGPTRRHLARCRYRKRYCRPPSLLYRRGQPASILLTSVS
jgi:trk system potassium uptake protein